MIDSNCGECQNDLIKKQRGCESPTQMPVWVIDDYEFFICPLSFLSYQILTWYKKYKLIKDGICKPVNYNNSSPKFLDAINIYDHYYNKFRNEKIEVDKQEKNFKKLREAKQWQKK